MYGMNWKGTITNLTKDFADFGCRYTGKKTRETALGYDCTELFFWNWMDGECDRSEKGFLRVLGYAWRKALQEETEVLPRPVKAAAARVQLPAGRAA